MKLISDDYSLISSATVSSLDWVLLMSTTLNPILAKYSAYALPIPSVLPVTTKK